MGVRVYNLFIVIADIILMTIKWWYFTFEALYKLFVPPEEVSVKGDIVFVSINISNLQTLFYKTL